MTEKINLSKNIWELTKSLQDTEPNTTLTQPGSMSNHIWMAVAELPVIMFLMWMLCTSLYSQTTNTIVSESLGSPEFLEENFCTSFLSYIVLLQNRLVQMYEGLSHMSIHGHQEGWENRNHKYWIYLKIQMNPVTTI